MRIDLYTKLLLTVIASALVVIAIRPLLHPEATSAQGISYAYLIPQAGDADTSGGKQFIDLRNGTSWICNFKGCRAEGRFTLEDTH
jgi:hypothetical protein